MSESFINCIAGAIVRGPQDPEWNFLYSDTIPMMEVKGFRLARPIDLMKHGDRNLSKITQGCDASDSQILEDILKLVQSPGAIRSSSQFAYAMTEAIDNNDLNKLRLLLSMGYPVNQPCPNLSTSNDNHGVTCMHYAVQNDTMDVMDLLLQHGGDPTARDEDGDSALSMATTREKFDWCDMFLSLNKSAFSVSLNEALNYLDVRGRHPMESILYKWTDEIIAFVEKLVSDHQITISKQMFADKESNFARILMHRLSDAIADDDENKGYRSALIVLALGYPPDLVFDAMKTSDDKGGITPLYYACYHGKIRIAQLLLEGGANPKLITDAGMAAIDITMFGNHASEEMSCLLIKYGVNPNSLLHNGTGSVTLSAVVQKQWIKLFDVCLEHGGDCLVPSSMGTHLLCYAAQEDNREIVPIIVKHCGNREHRLLSILNARQPREPKSWPLWVSVHNRNHEFTRQLLEAGADPDMQVISDSRSCLHCAVLNGDFLTVRMLVEHGANVNIKSADKVCRPLDFAINKNNNDIALYLVEKGSDPNAPLDDVPGSPQSYMYADEPFRTQLRNAWTARNPASPSKTLPPVAAASTTTTTAQSHQSPSKASVSAATTAKTASPASSQSAGGNQSSALNSFREKLGALSLASSSQSASSPAPGGHVPRPPPAAGSNTTTTTPAVITGASSLTHPVRTGRMLETQSARVPATTTPSAYNTARNTMSAKVISPNAMSGMVKESEECCICMTRKKNATLIHGGTGHLCCCTVCARELKDRGDTCPICREHIDLVIETFPS
jgi:ankyrin repeat protein